jgi:hypothetical protein
MMSQDNPRGDYNELGSIFKCFLGSTLKWITDDVEKVIGKVKPEADDWRDADDHFGQSFLSLWFMFENKRWTGNELPAKVDRPDQYFDNEPPFKAILEKESLRGKLPDRPTISGFLTEVYVRTFLRRLLISYDNLEVHFGDYDSLAGRRLGIGYFRPDIVILAVEGTTLAPALVAEVKTTIGTKDGVSRILERREKCKAAGVGFVLFHGHGGERLHRAAFQYLRDRGGPLDWVYYPGDQRNKRLKTIVDTILKAVRVH